MKQMTLYIFFFFLHGRASTLKKINNKIFKEFTKEHEILDLETLLDEDVREEIVYFFVKNYPEADHDATLRIFQFQINDMFLYPANF